MMFISLIALKVSDPKTMVIWSYKESDLLQQMILEGEVDFEMLFDEDEIAVLHNGAMVLGSGEELDLPDLFDIVQPVPFIKMKSNAVLFYVEPRNN